MASLSVILVDDAFVLIMGTLTLLLVVLTVIVFAFLFQRKLIKKQKAFREIESLLQKQEVISAYQIMEAQELERKRIAEDLHDGLGSSLAAVKFHLHAYKNNPTNTEELFNTTTELLDLAVKEVRDISHNMIAGVLPKSGLTHAIQDLKNTIEASHQLKFQLHIHHLDDRLDRFVEINIYRIIQESISNILKHAHASEIILQLSRHENDLLLIIEDNGIGFNTNTVNLRAGIGLKNIESRVDALAGKLQLDSIKGKGTIITVEIPITNDKNLDRG